MFLTLELLVALALLGACLVSRRLYGRRSLLLAASLLISLYWFWFFGPLTNIVGALRPDLIENPSSGLNWNIYPPLFQKAALMAGASSVLSLLLLIALPKVSRCLKRCVSHELRIFQIVESSSLRIYAYAGTMLLATIAWRFGSIIGTEYFDFGSLNLFDKAVVSTYFSIPAGPAIALGVLGVSIKKRSALYLVLAACLVNIIAFIVFRQRLYCLISSFAFALSLASLLGIWRQRGLHRLITLSALFCVLLSVGYSFPTVLKGQFGPAGFSPDFIQIEQHFHSLNRRLSLDFGYRLSGVGSSSTALHVRNISLEQKCPFKPELSLFKGPLASEFIGSLPLSLRQILGYEPSRLPEYLIGQCYGKNQVDLVETQALPFFLQFDSGSAVLSYSVWLAVSRLGICVLLWCLIRMLSVDVAGFLFVPVLYLGVVTGGVGEFMAFAKVLPFFLVLYALPSALFQRKIGLR